MNGVGLTTVGRLLGHRRRESTAIYAHLDDEALQDAAARAADVIARAMGYRVTSRPAPKDSPMHVEGHANMRPVPADRATDWTAV
jgi:hypothetical protein